MLGRYGDTWCPPAQASSCRSSQRGMETRVIFLVSELMFFNLALNIDKAGSGEGRDSSYCAFDSSPRSHEARTSRGSS